MTYTITHEDCKGKVKSEVRFSFFDKTKLQTIFDQFVEVSKPGDTVEYMKEDKRYYHPAMLYVENLDGRAYVYNRGKKKLYSVQPT